MPEIKTKLELDDLLQLMVVQFETLFATNNSGQLSAADLREYMQTQIDYLTILNDSLKIQRQGIINLDGPVETILPDQIDENVVFVHGNGVAQTVNLPPVTPENNGIIISGIMPSVNNVTFVADGGEFIYGTQPNAEGIYTLTPVFLKLGWVITFKSTV